MKRIKLTQSKSAQVSDKDYAYLNRWKWCAHKDGKTFYAVRHIRKGAKGKRQIIKMHQVLAEVMGFKNRADHKNRNGLDNQRSNLRDATQTQNLQNRGKFKNNTSGCTGVSWYARNSKWKAYIYLHGKYIHLGYFEKFDSAKRVRKQAEGKYFT